MTTLKDKELDITISKLFAIDDFDNIETSGFETKDVKEAVIEFKKELNDANLLDITAKVLEIRFKEIFGDFEK